MHTTEAADRPAAEVPTAEVPAATDPVVPAAEAGIFHEALAERFSERLAYDARYVAAWNRWLFYDGVAWRPDETLRALGEARAVCRAAAHAAGDARDKLRIGSAAMVAAVERLARASRHHAASAEQWDADPWLLNTPAGTIDLRDAAMQAHDHGDYITKVTAVAPRGDCPLFRAFLARIFARDEALIGFVQRALGYALSGANTEHALFFAFGTGGNGKGVLLNTIARILGGYAAVAPVDGFIATQAPGHASELAMLRGARFVLVPESAPGAPWNAPQNATETAANLFASWATYAQWAKEPVGSRKAFALAMRARGFAPVRIGDAGAKGYKGIRLRRHSPTAVMTAAMSGQRIPIEGL